MCIRDSSTKCKTPLALWDSRKQRLIGKSAMAVSVNQKLGECTALIHARFHELYEREETFTATDVRDAYQGQVHRQALLLESFGEYLTQTKAVSYTHLLFRGLLLVCGNVA